MSSGVGPAGYGNASSAGGQVRVGTIGGDRNKATLARRRHGAARKLTIRGRLELPRHKHGNIGMREYVPRSAAKHPFAKPRMTISTHDQQIGPDSADFAEQSLA